MVPLRLQVSPLVRRPRNRTRSPSSWETVRRHMMVVLTCRRSCPLLYLRQLINLGPFLLPNTLVRVPEHPLPLSRCLFWDLARWGYPRQQRLLPPGWYPRPPHCGPKNCNPHGNEPTTPVRTRDVVERSRVTSFAKHITTLTACPRSVVPSGGTTGHECEYLYCFVGPRIYTSAVAGLVAATSMVAHTLERHFDYSDTLRTFV